MAWLNHALRAGGDPIESPPEMVQCILGNALPPHLIRTDPPVLAGGILVTSRQCRVDN